MLAQFRARISGHIAQSERFPDETVKVERLLKPSHYTMSSSTLDRSAERFPTAFSTAAEQKAMKRCEVSAISRVICRSNAQRFKAPSASGREQIMPKTDGL
jgi:hypothetical protein